MNFQNIEIKINGQYLMVEEASLNESNQVNPSYSVGFAGPLDYNTSEVVRNTLQISYILETNNEPNYQIVSQIKNYQPISTIPITIGGISNNFYLDSYSFNIQPNSIIRAEANYTSYEQIQNSLQATGTGNFNVLNSSGIGHYNSTTATISGQNVTGSVLQMDYSFRINYDVQRGIGQTSPYQITFLSAEENFDFTTETLNHITYSAKDGNNFFSTFNYISLNNISSVYSTGIYSLPFSLNGAKVISNKIGIPTNNIITINSSLVKAW